MIGLGIDDPGVGARDLAVGPPFLTTNLVVFKAESRLGTYSSPDRARSGAILTARGPDLGGAGSALRRRATRDAEVNAHPVGARGEDDVANAGGELPESLSVLAQEDLVLL